MGARTPPGLYDITIHNITITLMKFGMMLYSAKTFSQTNNNCFVTVMLKMVVIKLHYSEIVKKFH